MPSENSPGIIVSGLHFDLTPSLKTFVHQKAGRLLRHDKRIACVRVDLDCEQKRPGHGWFVARGHLTSYGPGLYASVASEDCHHAISRLIDKLDRMLRRRAVSAKEKRNHPQLIDFSAMPPKTA